MAAFTAAAQMDSQSGLGAWSGPTARTGFGSEPSVGVGTHTLDETYIGPGFEEVATGLDPEPSRYATWTPEIPRYDTATAAESSRFVASADHDLTYPDSAFKDTTYIGPGFTEEGYGVQSNSAFGVGSVIPTSYFRKIEGTIYDENDNPITEGVYVLATDDFSTAGPVRNDGTFSLYLLRTEYESFMLVAREESTENVDYVWYQLSDRQTRVTATEQQVDLYFDRERVIASGGGKPGLSMSMDVMMGRRPPRGGGG